MTFSPASLSTFIILVITKLDKVFQWPWRRFSLYISRRTGTSRGFWRKFRSFGVREITVHSSNFRKSEPLFENSVSFDKRLSLSNENYQLRSIVVHMGSYSSGHYYTTISKDDKWYEVNDNTPQDANDHLKELEASSPKSGYGLLYIKEGYPQNLCD